VLLFAEGEKHMHDTAATADLIWRTVNFIVLVGLVLAPFFINNRLVKTRGREKEKMLWMLLTLVFSWITTFVLAIIKPKDNDRVVD
jgi:O-antigen/teichoic acid export membrane protein